MDTRRFAPAQEAYPRYEYRVDVERRATFYIWRVMVPLTLLVAVSWVAFWFEPVGLQPQISTCMATLIAPVAFHFAIDFALPKVAYLTLIDRHALIGFGFVAAAVVAVTLVHIADRGREGPLVWASPPSEPYGRISRIRLSGRWSYLRED